MLDNTNELGELKSLLFEEEIDAFNALEKQIETLRLEQHSIEDVLEKIKPLLDDFLEERLSHKDARTTQIYAQYLSQIISKSVALDSERLSQALQPVISPAIAKEIEENQDKMVDALYPIMGSMISKYVSNAIHEMMEKINHKVEDGLSFGSYKRKIKAKISGVSESELLLEESHQAMIRSLFIIEKESSLLIVESHVEDQEISDPHMVASMASAIKDFVNDWIAEHQESSEVQLLSYGNETLYIESAGSVYLIAFLDTEPDHEQRREIQEFFAEVIKEYSGFFQIFDGDDSVKDILKLKKVMQIFLNKQRLQEEYINKKHRPFMKYVLMIGLFLFLLYSAMQIKDHYSIYKLEKKIFDQTGEVVQLEFKDNKNTIYLTGEIGDSEHYKVINAFLQNKGYKVDNKVHVSFELFQKTLEILKSRILIRKNNQ